MQMVCAYLLKFLSPKLPISPHGFDHALTAYCFTTLEECALGAYPAVTIELRQSCKASSYILHL